MNLFTKNHIKTIYYTYICGKSKEMQFLHYIWVAIFNLGLAQGKMIKNRWFYFSFLIWPYDVNMSIDKQHGWKQHTTWL